MSALFADLLEWMETALRLERFRNELTGRWIPIGRPPSESEDRILFGGC